MIFFILIINKKYISKSPKKQKVYEIHSQLSISDTNSKLLTSILDKIVAKCEISDEKTPTTEV